MDDSISTSAATLRSFHPENHFPSTPSSPCSSAPPDSPSSDSVSSFPSVSSSFFFSSAAASPPHSRPQSDDARDETQGLIIPSLTLPAALRRPTPYGQTLGDLRLLVLGSEGAGKSFLTGVLLDDNEDVIDVGQCEEAEYGRVLRASTDWVEHTDAHGLEKFEPTRNVEILELPGYDHTTNVHFVCFLTFRVTRSSHFRLTAFCKPSSLSFKHRFTLYLMFWIRRTDLLLL
jgi:hypothetical protein